MKLGLVIASHGRPHILKEVLWSFASQLRIPDYTVLSAVVSEDIPDLCPSNANVQLIFGAAGSSGQRNRGIAELIDKTDVIIFIDDDFIVGDDYFLNLEAIFAQDSSIVGVNGMVIADGASLQVLRSTKAFNCSGNIIVKKFRSSSVTLKVCMAVTWLSERRVLVLFGSTSD